MEEAGGSGGAPVVRSLVAKEFRVRNKVVDDRVDGRELWPLNGMLGEPRWSRCWI